MEEFKSQKIKAVLKGLLKKKDINYENLSGKLECSVPTVKRILGPEELTLNRLLQICEIVGIDLAELEALTKTKEAKDEKFTEAQEAFLVKNKSYFAYLMKIFSGESPKQIAQGHNLTQRSTDKYLINLEKHGLIHVTGTQKVKPAFKSVPNLGNGALAKAHFENLIHGGAKFFINYIHEKINSATNSTTDREKPGGKFAISAHLVTKETYTAWTREQNKALKEFTDMAYFEEKTKDASELMTVVLIDANALVEKDDKNLKVLDNALGEIVNL